MNSLMILLICCSAAWSQTVVPASVIDLDTTWPLAGSPYIVTGRVQVYGSAMPRLSIEPGVEVRFQNTGTLEFGISHNWDGAANAGQLTAIGTAQDPILFVQDTPGVFWDGIRFYNASDAGGASSQLEYAQLDGADIPIRCYYTSQPAQFSNLQISNASQHGIYLEQCAPVPGLQDVDLSFCAQYPLVLSGTALPASSNVSLLNNGDDRVSFTGTIPVNMTLDLASWPLPVLFTSATRVYGSANPRLTLPAGTELRFAPGATLEIAILHNWDGAGNRGELEAVGTELDPVRMVADTPGQAWGGLRFYNASDFEGASSVLEHVEIDEATYGLRHEHTAEPSIVQGVSITNATHEGITLVGNELLPAFDAIEVHDCGGFPLLLNGTALPGITGFNHSGNGSDHVAYTGILDFSYTMDLGSWPADVLFTGATRVYGSDSPRLTIPAGTELRFASGATLEIGILHNWDGAAYRGELEALGTALDPIHLVADVPGAAWGGLRFYNASDFDGATSQLEHVVIDEATYGLRHEYTAQPSMVQNVSITNSSNEGITLLGNETVPAFNTVDVQGSGSYPLLLSGSALPVLDAFTHSGNADEHVAYTGTLTFSYTMDLSAWPADLLFVSATRVYSSANPRLTIPAGTELRFASGATLEIGILHNWDGAAYRGELEALGSALDPVRFVAGTPGQPWGGLRFYNASDFDGGSSQLEHVEIDEASYGLRLEYTAQPDTVRNVSITNTGYEGITLVGNPAVPVFDTVDVQGSASYPMLLNASALPVLNGFSHSNNLDEHIAFTGNITYDYIMDLSAWTEDLLFINRTSVYNAANPRLTIPAGTELRFASGASLEIGILHNWEGASYRGELEAVGSAPEPIRMVADIPGQAWGGLRFYNSSDFDGAGSQLEHVEIEGATYGLRQEYTLEPALIRQLSITGSTYDGITLVGCIPASDFESVEVQGSGGYPMLLWGSALPLTNGFAAGGHSDDRVAYSGTIAQDLTLDLASWPHDLVFTGATIVEGAEIPRLTIPAGTELRFLPGASLHVANRNNYNGTNNRGQLRAVGTPADLIRFVADDPVQGWDGVRFHQAADTSPAESELQHVLVQGATENLVMQSTDSPALLDVQLVGALSNGLRLSDSYPLVSRCGFLDNGTGLEIENAGITVIGDTLSNSCTFLANRDWNLFNDGGGDVLARHNGWCLADGATVADMVFDQVDDPGKGLVSYNPTSAVGFLRVDIEFHAESNSIRLEWCPLIGASSYSVYGVADGFPAALPEELLDTTTDTWVEFSLEGWERMSFMVTAELASVHLMNGNRSTCH